jgi:hypothetical protein
MSVFIKGQRWIAAWQRDHSGAEVIADLTGGTKAMAVTFCCSV